MIRIGLTGSIGTGKSTTAALFASEGAPVYDADQAVHDLYGPGGAAVAPVEAAFPGVAAGGRIDRSRLSQALLADPAGFARLEAVVHPLIAAGRAEFLRAARAAGADVAVLDTPLLFETGGEGAVDLVCVTTCPPEVQRARVLARPNMTEEKLQAILARQTPDAVKRARADVVIDTGLGLEAAREAVRELLKRLRGGWRPARAGATPEDLDPRRDAPQGPPA